MPWTAARSRPTHPHSALSYGHIKQLEQQLKEEVVKLMALAEQADNEKIPDGMNLPKEIAHREERLKAIATARAKIEERADERFEQEQAEYQARLEKREAKSRESGKPPRGKPPVPPQAGARDRDQINLTDEESRIMPVSGGGFEQCYNGQIAVDMESLLIVKTDAVQATSERAAYPWGTQQLVPSIRYQPNWASPPRWWPTPATSPRPTSRSANRATSRR